MTSIDELLEKPKEFETDTVDVDVSGSLVTLKFTELPGNEWAEITARCPVRPTVPLDTAYGYNIHAASTFAASESGVQVDGDTEIPLSDETWQKLLGRLSGSDFAAVASVVFGLNVWAPQQRVKALKKASAATTASTKK